MVRKNDQPANGWFEQLKRRGVFRVAGSYAVIAWLLLQIADVVFDPLGIPGWVMRALIVVVVLGFPIAVALAWFFDITDDGIERDRQDRLASAVNNSL